MVLQELAKRKRRLTSSSNLGLIRIEFTRPLNPNELPPRQNIEWNLRRAEQFGVKPLSFNNILTQIKEAKYPISNVVLFDTPPKTENIGNHWRVLGFDKEKTLVTLNLCDRLGNNHKHVKPVDVSIKKPLFTGIIMQEYKNDEEIVLWSNESGQLK